MSSGTVLSGPPLRDAPAHDLLAPLWERALREPRTPLFAHRVGDEFVDVDAGTVATRVRAVASGLVATGIQPGDRVALLSRTRMEWAVADLAILAAGAVTVPIYDTSSPEQIRWTVHDSGAVAAIVETTAQRETFDALAERLPACGDVRAIDEGGLDALADAGAGPDDAAVDERLAAVEPDDVATLVYSSGTTGRPKGCILTHSNICHDVRQTVEHVPDIIRSDQPSTLIFLPLAHAFARIQLYLALEQGLRIGFATSPKALTEEFPLFRPTLVVGVPRIFEKVYTGARAAAQQRGRGSVFDRAADVAERVSRHRQDGTRPPLTTRLAYTLFDRLVYTRLRAAFGGRVRYAISGGSALAPKLGHFFTGAGIRILEGYGLTETSPIASSSPTERIRIGTVGLPLPATDIRLGDDGEVAIRGPQVFGGYYNDPDATDQVLRDGWFATGDVGALDDEGYLRITGRIKDIIITAGGKNVVPGVLEEEVRANPLVADCVVVGEGQPFVAALVTLDPEEVARWAAERGRDVDDVQAWQEDPEIRTSVAATVDVANAAVSKAEQIRAFTILSEPFEIETGDLTPTLKVRRAAVTTRYADRIAAMYDQDGTSGR